MTGHTQLAVTPRDRFLEAAQKELIAFERRNPAQVGLYSIIRS
jgi:hypothetical protein